MCEHNDFFCLYCCNGIMIRRCKKCKEFEIQTDYWVNVNEMANALTRLNDLIKEANEKKKNEGYNVSDFKCPDCNSNLTYSEVTVKDEDEKQQVHKKYYCPKCKKPVEVEGRDDKPEEGKPEE